MTKTTLIILSFVTLSLAMLGCSGDANTNRVTLPNPIHNEGANRERYVPRVAQKPEQVLIYIDLTSSVKPEGIERIAAKLKSVLLKLPRGSVATIRLVEKNLLGESPFDPLQAPGSCVIEESEIERKRIDAQKACDDASTPYVARVNAAVQRVQTVKPKVDVSCIMDTFEAANDFFKVKDPHRSKFRLIYFSDMIEQCPSNAIYTCSKTREPKKEEIMSRIGATFHPSFNLEAILGNSLSIIITASDNLGNNCLSLSDHKDIWRSAFSKIGYHNLDISDFNFTQEIPDALHSP